MQWTANPLKRERGGGTKEEMKGKRNKKKKVLVVCTSNVSVAKRGAKQLELYISRTPAGHQVYKVCG